MAQYALNLRPEANLHWSALPTIAPWLYRYWRASTPAGLAATSRAARPLIERCILEHEALMAEAGILGMIRRTGYLRFHRSARGAGGGDRQGRGRPRDLRGQFPTRRRAASWPSWSRICAAPTSAAC